MDSFSAYLPLDRRYALAKGESLPEKERGAVLFTDISGFTTLTEALVNTLGYQRGAEELSQYLDKVFEVLTAEVARYRGSVISSGGDALLSWFKGFDKEAAQRALTAAFAMQTSMPAISTYVLPDGGSVSLNIKSAVACGVVRRFLVGDPQVQVFEVLAGSLLDRVDLAQTMADRGQVVVSAETAAMLGNNVSILERRHAADGASVAILGGIPHRADPQPWSDLGSLDMAQVRPWLHPFLLEYLNSGQEMFMAQLRPSVALFMHFDGIDYEHDEEAGARLDSFFRWVQKQVEYYGGMVIDLTTGDKGSYLYIAVGTPYAHEDDPSRAVALAQSLLALPPELSFIQHLQIGISRGTIWSGPIGGPEWRTFAAVGNEVNLAARLMQSALPNHMLVSERIAEATRQDFRWYFLQEMRVKGIAKPVKVFETFSTKTKSRARKPVSSADIVGREAERALLKDALQNTSAASSRIIVIEGEAGIGKSRLIGDLVVQARAETIPVLVGAGYAVEQSTAYHAWRTVFESVFELEASDEGERRRQKALDWLARYEPELCERAPLLAPVLSLDMQDNSLTEQMTGQVRADNTRALLIAILRAYIGDSRKLLVLEDAHWFDSASLTLTLDATRSLTNATIVIATRLLRGQLPEHFDTLLALPQTRHIRLGQLDHTDITSLVCQRLNVNSLPEQVSRLILSKAEGHPFFSEELAFSLYDSRAIIVENGECKVAPNVDLRALSFPDTVQGVIRSRIDRLPPTHQLALKAASVLGRVFALRAVHEIYPLNSERPRVGGYFEYLRKLDFTPLNSEVPDLTYLFKHVITQEVAYNLMTFSQRKAFHEAVAKWYEKTFAEDLSPYYGVLAHHWNNAKHPQKTIEYLEKAGEQAMLNFANLEAIEFFGEALGLVHHGEVQVSALRHAHWERQLAEAHYGFGDLPKSREHLKRAIQLLGWQTPEKGLGLVSALIRELIKQIRFRMKPKPIAEGPLPTFLENTGQAKRLEGAKALVRLGHVYYQMNNPMPLIVSTLKAVNLAEEAAIKSPVLARCYTNMCVVSGILPRHDWAWGYRNRAHEVGRETNDLPSLSYAIAGCGTYEIGAALWQHTTKDYSEALEIDARIGDQRHYDEVKSLFSIMQFHQGDFRYGLETAAGVLERAKSRKDVIPQAWSHMIRAEIILRQSSSNTLHEAIAEYEEALRLLEQNIDLANQIRSTGGLAFVCWRHGETDRAIHLAADTIKMAAGNPTASYSMEGYAGAVEVFLHAWEQGDLKARPNARKTLKSLRKFAGVFPVGQPRYKLLEGWCLWLERKPQKARLAWETCLARAGELNMPYEQGRAYLYLGRHILQGEEKTRALTCALDLFTRTGILYEAEIARGLLT